MSLRQIAPGSKGSSGEAADSANPERCLTLLAEGAAINTPEIDAAAYQVFRANVGRLGMQLRDRMPDGEKLAQIRTILHEFEKYRENSDAALRECAASWRGLVSLLFSDLLASLAEGIESPHAAELRDEIPGLATVEDLQSWRKKAEMFFHPLNADGKPQGLASAKTANRSTANDNASGLCGGGSAVEDLKKIMARGGGGFIALFKLSCLDMISQRFGEAAVEDSLMAVSAFLIANLQSDDVMYHWNDSSLLAILQGRPSEQILAAELQRISSQNRESSINVAGRNIMLRIPLAFELTPINRLREAEDLYRLSTQAHNRRIDP